MEPTDPSDNVDAFSQAGYPVRLEWGPRGALMAAQRGDILVVVDVLRFSSAVAAAVEAGVRLFPALPEEAESIAAREGASLAIGSLEPAVDGRYSLSPAGFRDANPGDRVVVQSANGATCARCAGRVPYLFAAGLVTARAVGAAAGDLARSEGLRITVLACGERWREDSEEGNLRFAIEDYLGAGAVISCLETSVSPEAEVCRSAFEASRNNLRGLLWESASGRELREKGLSEDVDFCAALNLCEVVPLLSGGCFQDARMLDTS